LAQPNDIILIAGKGHETYQEIKGVRQDFDDMKIVKETLEQLGNSKNQDINSVAISKTNLNF